MSFRKSEQKTLIRPSTYKMIQPKKFNTQSSKILELFKKSQEEMINPQNRADYINYFKQSYNQQRKKLTQTLKRKQKNSYFNHYNLENCQRIKTKQKKLKTASIFYTTKVETDTYRILSNYTLSHFP